MARVNRYADECLMEIFGTTRPSPATINRWKLAWRDTGGKVAVESFHAARKLLAENDIDPLFYQFRSTSSYPDGEADSFCIVFFYDEHEVFFKLHSAMG
jgi:hypothetical protein